MAHIGTKFPTKEFFIAWLATKRPDLNADGLEYTYEEQQRMLTIKLDASCGEHGDFQYPAYDEEGFHQYHAMPKCPQCKNT